MIRPALIGPSEAPPRGLPEHLPAGERILWQGAPDAAALARSAFHTRAVAIYFAGLTAIGLGIALSRGTTPTGAAMTALCGAAAVALLRLIAWAAARGAVYTLTDRRLVLRIGIALPKSVNLPLSRIAAIDLSSGGDIALKLTETLPLGWLALWPHARPWRLARPEPTLRALPDAAAVAQRIGRACLAVAPEGRLSEPVAAAPAEPRRPQAVAA